MGYPPNPPYPPQGPPDPAPEGWGAPDYGPHGPGYGPPPGEPGYGPPWGDPGYGGYGAPTGGQPGYGAFPPPSPPPGQPPPRRNGNGGLIAVVAVGAVLVLLIAGVTAVLFFSRSSSSNPTESEGSADLTGTYGGTLTQYDSAGEVIGYWDLHLTISGEEITHAEESSEEFGYDLCVWDTHDVVQTGEQMTFSYTVTSVEPPDGSCALSGDVELQARDGGDLDVTVTIGDSPSEGILYRE